VTLLAPASPAVLELAAAEAERVLAIVQAGIAAARRASPEDAVEFDRALAGHAARFRVFGRQLARALAAPFAHLPRPDPGSEPALFIELVDRSATTLTHREGQLDELLPPGDLTAASPDGRLVIYRRNATLTCLDRSRKTLTGWTEAAERLSLTERGRPLDALLYLWLHDQGIERIHAGLIAADGHGILVVGKSGSGKTTTVLGCLGDGFDFISDDRVGLEARIDAGYTGHGLHGSAYLHAEDVARFPWLAPHADREDGKTGGREEKVLVSLSAACPERLKPAAPIDLLLLPRVSGGSRPRIRPARKAEALLRLAPSSFWVVRHPGAAGLQRQAELVERVPCFWLELGGAPSLIGPVVRALLREVDASTGAHAC
jgi:hypothetical protein